MFYQNQALNDRNKQLLILCFRLPSAGLQGSATCPVPLWTLFVGKETKQVHMHSGKPSVSSPHLLWTLPSAVIGQTLSVSLIRWVLAEDTAWASFWPLSHFSEDSGAWGRPVMQE